MMGRECGLLHGGCSCLRERSQRLRDRSTTLRCASVAIPRVGFLGRHSLAHRSPRRKRRTQAASDAPPIPMKSTPASFMHLDEAHLPRRNCTRSKRGVRRNPLGPRNAAGDGVVGRPPRGFVSPAVDPLPTRHCRGLEAWRSSRGRRPSRARIRRGRLEAIPERRGPARSRRANLLPMSGTFTTENP